MEVPAWDEQKETIYRFGNLDRIAKYLDKSHLAVAEAVFGVLLAALAVELVLRGLADLGIIDLVAH